MPHATSLCCAAALAVALRGLGGPVLDPALHEGLEPDAELAGALDLPLDARRANEDEVATLKDLAKRFPMSDASFQ